MKRQYGLTRYRYDGCINLNYPAGTLVYTDYIDAPNMGHVLIPLSSPNDPMPFGDSLYGEWDDSITILPEEVVTSKLFRLVVC